MHRNDHWVRIVSRFSLKSSELCNRLWSAIFPPKWPPPGIVHYFTFDFAFRHAFKLMECQPRPPNYLMITVTTAIPANTINLSYCICSIPEWRGILTQNIKDRKENRKLPKIRVFSNENTKILSFSLVCSVWLVCRVEAFETVDDNVFIGLLVFGLWQISVSIYFTY